MIPEVPDLPDSARTAPSSRSAGQRVAESAKRHAVGVAGGAGVTLISALTILAQALESAGKISSALGIQFGAMAVTAIVIFALHVPRQEARDARERQEREAARNAYQGLIERVIDRNHEDSQDAHAELLGKVSALTAQQAELVRRFDDAEKRGTTLRFGGGQRLG